MYWIRYGLCFTVSEVEIRTHSFAREKSAGVEADTGLCIELDMIFFLLHLLW